MHGVTMFLSLIGLSTLFRYRIHVWITSSTASGLQIFYTSLEISQIPCFSQVEKKKNSYRLPGIRKDAKPAGNTYNSDDHAPINNDQVRYTGIEQLWILLLYITALQTIATFVRIHSISTYAQNNDMYFAC